MRNWINKTNAGRFLWTNYMLYKYYLKDTGWLKSTKLNQSVSVENKPLPWLSFSFQKFLEGRVNSNLSILEYGSGNSTLWFSERVKNIISVEHDKSWYEFISNKLNSKPNIEYHFKDLENKEYEEFSNTLQNSFDIILIDGRKRVACAHNSLRLLKSNGVIIWDNSERPQYQQGIEDLLKAGFKKLDFWGLSASSYMNSCTSVLYKTDNCLGI